jgi:hypothetical protein
MKLLAELKRRNVIRMATTKVRVMASVTKARAQSF